MIFGISMENEHGTKEIVKIYCFSGIGGFITSSLFNDTLSVGASCSIMGIFAAWLVYYIVNWNAINN